MCVLRVRVGSSQKKLLSVGSLQALFRARRRAHDLVFVKDLTVRAAFNQPSQQNLLSVFTFVDVSGDGTISVAEFTAAIRRASMCVGMRWKWEVGGEFMSSGCLELGIGSAGESRSLHALPLSLSLSLSVAAEPRVT
jgi:hypothetical protein